MVNLKKTREEIEASLKFLGKDTSAVKDMSDDFVYGYGFCVEVLSLKIKKQYENEALKIQSN